MNLSRLSIRLKKGVVSSLNELMTFLQAERIGSDDVLAAEVQAVTEFRIPFVEPGKPVDIVASGPFTRLSTGI